ncbi:OmpA family protein [Rhodovastum atsumiense]|nr:OmpA family protein [Rhodovastum atsumiense]CAH2604175.1 OmpA family protein [Rhodovastum atsumiense]
MQKIILSLAMAGLGAVVLVAPRAHAQATMDQRALEQLQKPGTGSEAPKQAAPARPAHPAQPPVKHSATPPPPHPPAPPQVRVPLAAPPPPVLPPALAVPTRPPAPPAPVQVSADAPGAAAPLPEGLRITFGSGSADLNPATDSALRKLAGTAPATASFSVAAFAPGTPEDPSTPRRTALSRALAVRSVLIAEGIASPRIYVKAIGANAPIAEGPADRVDVTVSTATPQAKSP